MTEDDAHAKARRREDEVEELAAIVIDRGLALHRELGPGLLESVYEWVLTHDLERRGIRVSRQRPIDISYDGLVFRDAFRVDLLIENRLLVELKSVERLAPLHGKQVLTYLRLMQLPLGLLMNFGAGTFKEGLRRVVNNHSFASSRLRVNQAPQIIVDP
jgi:iron complex transport system substrate-binding protein